MEAIGNGDNAEFNRGLTGAIGRLTDPQGVTCSVITGRLGSFTFGDVEPRQTYIVNVSSIRFNFQSQVIQVNDNVAELNFIPQ